MVSGRTTPTCRLLAPLVPAWASALNWLIVDPMLTVKESMFTEGTVVEAAADDDEPDEAGALDELDEDEDEQPAAVRARAAPRATQPALGKRRNVPCVREYRPPSLLLLTRIPYTLSPECNLNKPTGTPVHQRCPFGGKLVHSTPEIQGRKFSRQQNVRPRGAIRPVMMSNCGRLAPGTCSPGEPGATSSPDALEPGQQPPPGHGR